MTFLLHMPVILSASERACVPLMALCLSLRRGLRNLDSFSNSYLKDFLLRIDLPLSKYW